MGWPACPGCMHQGILKYNNNLSRRRFLNIFLLNAQEVLRLTISATALRRVMKPGFVVNGYEIPAGSFLCYSLGTSFTMLLRNGRKKKAILEYNFNQVNNFHYIRDHPFGPQLLQGSIDLRSRPLRTSTRGGQQWGLCLPRLGSRWVSRYHPMDGPL